MISFFYYSLYRKFNLIQGANKVVVVVDHSDWFNCTWNILKKMPKHLSEKLARKFYSTLDYSLVRISHLGDAFSRILELKGTQHLQHENKKRRKLKR